MNVIPEESRHATMAVLLCIAGLPGLSGSAAQAATVVPSSPANVSGNWEQNWTGATMSDGTFLLPAASVPDTAVINDGRTIEVTTSVGVHPGAVTVGNPASGQNDAFLNVDAGGSLVMTGGMLTVTARNGTGTVNVQGGSLTTDSSVDVRRGGVLILRSGSFTNNGAGSRSIFQDTNGAGGIVNITGGTLTTLGTAPDHLLRFENDTINISGGTVIATGGQVLFANTTTLTITGDAASIQLDRLNMNSASRAATVNFDFGPTGVSTIRNNSFLNLSNATLNIDGSNYIDTGIATSFDLFTARNVASLAPAVNVSGFGVEGVHYTFEQSTTENIVRLNVFGPGPASRFARIDLDGSDNSLFNGSFEDVTVDAGVAGENAWVTGSNSNFSGQNGNIYTVHQWAPFFSDPHDVIGRYGPSGSVATDSWYTGTTSNTNSGQGIKHKTRGILLDSADSYQSGMVNEDFLSGLDPKFINPVAQYRLSIELSRRGSNLGGDETATTTVSVTDSAVDPSNSDNAIPGGVVTGTISDLPIGTTQFVLELSGADLANATQLNLVIENTNVQDIGFENTPGLELAYVSQIFIDNFQLTGYLPGDSDGDFDVDADDLAAWGAGYGTTRADNKTSFAWGDFDADGEVDSQDFFVWQQNLTGALSQDATAVAVPEPNGCVLIIPLAMWALLLIPRFFEARSIFLGA